MAEFGSQSCTRGWRVEVEPRYLADRSEPHRRAFVFAYRVRITNESDDAARLVSRHWVIVDADGKRDEVQGEGVVGQQPFLRPGETHEYASYCPLRTPWGTMEGSYVMRAEDGEEFSIAIGRFYLAATADVPV